MLGGLDLIAHPSSYFLWLTLFEDKRPHSVAAAVKSENVLVATAEPFSATSSAPNALRVALGSMPVDLMQAALRKVRLVAGD